VTWCFDLPFAGSVQDSLPISPSSHLDVHLLCLLVTRHKLICHILQLNPSKPGPWKFPASIISSRQSNLLSLERRLNEVIFFIQSYEISGNKDGNPGLLLSSMCIMHPGWHFWAYSRLRSWFVHRWHVVHTYFDFTGQVDREEVLMSPIVPSSTHKSTRSNIFTYLFSHGRKAQCIDLDHLIRSARRRKIDTVRSGVFIYLNPRLKPI